MLHPSRSDDRKGVGSIPTSKLSRFGISGEDKCNSLLNAALAAGSDDDMTAIFVCTKEE